MKCNTENPANVEQIKPKINGDMTIAEVIEIVPDAREILTAYGLHCVGCHANVFESLKEGTMGHGMPEEQFNKMIDDLNEAINKEISEELILTDKAAQAIGDLIKQENKTALKIQVLKGGCAGHSYDFSLVNDKLSDEKELDINGVKVFIDQDSFEKMKGSKIDYVVGLQGAGIKVENPNAKAKCGCGTSFA